MVMMLWLAIVPIAAAAENGGYPASPSHGVVGTNPDGTPRYGGEPGKQQGRSPETVGHSGAGRIDAEPPRTKDSGEEKPNAAAKAR